MLETLGKDIFNADIITFSFYYIKVSPIYEIVYMNQLIIHLNGTMSMIAVDLLFIAMSVFFIEYLKVTQTKFEEAIKEKNRQKILSVIKNHQDLIFAFQKFNKLFGPILFVRCVEISIILALYCFQLIIVRTKIKF